jgi:putative endonuclease
MKALFVYMVTNRSRVVLDTGMTNDLERRVCEHKNGTAKGLTRQSKLDRLVYENYGDVRDAITREKDLPHDKLPSPN